MLIAPFTAFGLWCVYVFPLAPLHWAAWSLWPPLTAVLAAAIAYFGYRHAVWRVDHRLLAGVGGAIYRGWTVAFAVAALGCLALIDATELATTLVAAAVAWFFFDRPRGAAPAWAAGAAAIAVVVVRSPWVMQHTLCAAVCQVALLATAVLFVSGEQRRLRRFDWVAFVLLAPALPAISAFFFGTVPLPHPDARVRFLPAIARSEPARPAFATVDCDGVPLIAAAAAPGLVQLSGAMTALERSPLAGGVAVSCAGRRGLAFAAGDGDVVYRPEGAPERRKRLSERVDQVVIDEPSQLLFAGGRIDLLTTLRTPNLDVEAERRAGIGLDLIFAPAEKLLFRLTALRGVEALEPATLTPGGSFAMPLCVGGALAYDAGRRRLFVADWLSKAIVAIDVREMSEIGRWPAPLGVRSLAYDAARGLLLAGAEFHGEALVYRVGDQGAPLRLPVGQGVRSLVVVGDRCFGVSAAGAFVIDLPAVAAGFGS